jgi:hypothetical protein
MARAKKYEGPRNGLRDPYKIKGKSEPKKDMGNLYLCNNCYILDESLVLFLYQLYK